MRNDVKNRGQSAKVVGFSFFIFYFALFFCLMACSFGGDVESQRPGLSYTVNFNINGGSGTSPDSQSAKTGSSITLPGISGFSKGGYIFIGWNTSQDGTGTYYSTGSFYTITGDITLYAVWLTQEDLFWPVSVTTFNIATPAQWNNAVRAISGGGNDKAYIIYISDAISVVGTSYPEYTFGSVSGITVSLRSGRGADATLSLFGDGSMISIGKNQNVILRSINLQGSGWNDGLVSVRDGGTFTMENIGDEVISGYAVGVYVTDNGTFTMNSGKISGNTEGGQAVRVSNNGTFTMNGGEISSNSYRGAGAVAVNGGTFTMKGGRISDNFGPGVEIVSGTFTMNGGDISDNFGSQGGGVSVWGGTFTMNSGGISGNTSSEGGGVFVGNGTFTMNGGEISRNTSHDAGGGVYVDSNGTFTKTRGIIAGHDGYTYFDNVVEDDTGILDDRGHAVYVHSAPIKRRETTADQYDNLNSGVSGAAGGWEE
jgi:hypothetical protein